MKDNKKIIVKHWLKRIVAVLSIFAMLLVGAVLITNSLRERQVLAEEAKRKAMYDKILDSASISPTQLTVDFNQQTSTASPLIFGGSHTPPLDHDDAWNKIADAGVSIIRKDLYVEFSLPRNITIDDYKNNVNSIQDSNNWDLKTINSVKANLQRIKSKDIKVMGIMAYSPVWLNHTNSPFGVPKDWDVYKDIVKKIYTLYRDELDYIEIWNEPDHTHFLRIEGSNLTKEEAYRKIYFYASNAIREVDKEKNDGKMIPIGGPVESNPRVSNQLSSLVSDKQIKYLPDFISFHTYDTYDESLKKYNSIKINSLIKEAPVFITEWNMESKFFDPSAYKTGDKALIYTSGMLINYMKDNVQGANYFSLLPINIGDRGIGENTMGFYRWNNGKAELLPQARTWRILSKQMALGRGESKIYVVNFTAKSEKQKANVVDVALEAVGLTEDEELNTVGFINTLGQRGVALVNDSKESQVIDIQMKNPGFKKFARVKVYYANAGNEAKVPVYEGLVRVQDDQIKFDFFVPEETVMGVLFEEEKEWFDIFIN